MSQLPSIQESEASGEVAPIYEEIQRELGIPFVPNIDKTLAISPKALAGKMAAVSQRFSGDEPTRFTGGNDHVYRRRRQ